MTSRRYFLTGEQMLNAWLRRLGDEKASFVYVIQGQDCEPIKIGVAKDPESRMRSLQTGNWHELRLLCVVPGSYPLEADFHGRLRDAKLTGEWFTGPAIAGFLIWIKDFSHRALDVYDATGRLPSAVPPQRRVTRADVVGQPWSGPGLPHRWRTKDSDRPNPVTVRFVEPQPRT